MRDVLGPGTTLGYCTNVHANPIVDMRIHAPAIKARVNPQGPMGIGIWLSKPVAMTVFEHECSRGLPMLRDWFQEHDIEPFTFNGFPYGEFHEPIVKHRVYEPDWAQQDRWGYTLCLSAIHIALAGRNTCVERSISTLPLGWPHASRQLDISKATDQLLRVARTLCDQRAQFGIETHLDLEPEPGCILQRSEDVVQFMQQHLLRTARSHELSEEDVLRHIRVCHDVCHAAVMFEDQAEVLTRYRAAGIRVGKVQISNAVRADLRNLSAIERSESLAQLRQFSEDRYLHQTMISDKGNLTFREDLPAALSEFSTSDRAGDEWRVHFHVPVYVDHFGLLQTTQNEIFQCLSAIRPEDKIHHFEVETYAWNVLPTELKVADLSQGIARELMWVRDVAAPHRSPAV